MAQSTYTMNYSNFIGADMSSDARVVSRNRLAYAVNMWRDYESEQGAAIETVPGFRICINEIGINEDNIPISDLVYYKGKKNEYLIAQRYGRIFAFKISISGNKLNSVVESEAEIYKEMNVNGATSFNNNNRLYFVSTANGTGSKAHLIVVFEEGDNIKAEKVEEYYVPTTYYNGQPYEQRNGLTNKVKQISLDDGVSDRYLRYYENEYGSQIEEIEVVTYKLLEKCESIISVYVNDEKFEAVPDGTNLKDKNYVVKSGSKTMGVSFLPDSVKTNTGKKKTIEITYTVDTIHFNTIGELKGFKNDNMSMADAILGCTKSAVYDGRVFLTGNPKLPNTVFYSQRNLTGANDPTYFGVYNYFNDGEGNTPNVDLLAMPNMLMVMKSDTVQDGSVYYHVGADNPHSDETVRNLVPRVYPATKGAAGLGSAGKNNNFYSLSCNFLDDPVFLSRRGLEGVSKEQLTAERTIGHRSSNIDRLLIKEDLAHASIAEWKGYLVICCNGHIYLADSRTMAQHPDGSFQYEWFYLEGVGTYSNYYDAYKKMTFYPSAINNNNNNIVESLQEKNIKTWEKDDGEIISGEYVSYEKIGDVLVYYYVDENTKEKKLVDVTDQKVGAGDFFGAQHVLAVGDLLFFTTVSDLCVFNTDKRGVSIKDEQGNVIREVDDDKIDTSWYSFGGVAYRSACALRLDDCDKKSLTKTTLYGTSVARFKMMPGSRCRIKSSINGRDWIDIAETYNTRFDFSNLCFDNLSFAENEDNVMVIPEVSRGWVQKQYYFESDGFCEPFGFYELSYIYKIAGKIRYL